MNPSMEPFDSKLPKVSFEMLLLLLLLLLLMLLLFCTLGLDEGHAAGERQRRRPDVELGRLGQSFAPAPAGGVATLRPSAAAGGALLRHQRPHVAPAERLGPAGAVASQQTPRRLLQLVRPFVLLVSIKPIKIKKEKRSEMTIETTSSSRPFQKLSVQIKPTVIR